MVREVLSYALWLYMIAVVLYMVLSARKRPGREEIVEPVATEASDDEDASGDEGASAEKDDAEKDAGKESGAG